MTRRPVLALAAAMTGMVALAGGSDSEDAPVLALLLSLALGLVAAQWRAVAWAFVVPPAFLLPIYARYGDVMSEWSEAMSWYLAILGCFYVAAAIATAVAMRKLFDRWTARRPRLPSPAASRAGRRP